MDIAKQKLATHRDRALKKGLSASDYAQQIGIKAQRLARLVKVGNGVEPTISEALQIQAVAKISPKVWLERNPN